jgi:hypothetical protein
VQELWNSAQAQARRLLRILFLRGRAVSSCSGGARKREGDQLLRDVINRADVAAQPLRDWAASVRTYGWIWVLPIIAIGASLFIDIRARTIIWAAALGVMGAAYVLNARRCGRTHCRFTGPYYLAMILPVIMLGSGAFSGGLSAWLALAVLIPAGSKIIWWATERAWGTYS